MSNLVRIGNFDIFGNLKSYSYGMLPDKGLKNLREGMDIEVIETNDNDAVLAQKLATGRERNFWFIDIGLVSPEYLPLIHERLKYTDAEQRQREENRR